MMDVGNAGGYYACGNVSYQATNNYYLVNNSGMIWKNSLINAPSLSPVLENGHFFYDSTTNLKIYPLIIFDNSGVYWPGFAYYSGATCSEFF